MARGRSNQARVRRLRQTLSSVRGITREIVDKVIGLGLIDVRDIEKFGIRRLMEMLCLDEPTAQRAVIRCIEESK